eukprot:41699-Prymnesium_polylepis.1
MTDTQTSLALILQQIGRIEHNVAQLQQSSHAFGVSRQAYDEKVSELSTMSACYAKSLEQNADLTQSLNESGCTRPPGGCLLA